MIENVIKYFEQIDPVLAALYATTFTWLVTALGAASVFLFRKMNQKVLDGMLGFTGGVMIASIADVGLGMTLAALMGVVLSGEDVQEMPIRAIIKKGSERPLKVFMAMVVYVSGL